MDLSMRWLQEYMDLPADLSIHDFCERMTLSGSKVEGYSVSCEGVKNVVVGRVLSLERHPDSDHMWICQVDVGSGEPVQIVTGAQNVVAGALAPVALHKSRLPDGTEIRKGKLRGVESNGMLCSLSELGLTTHDFPYAIEDGIFLIGGDEGAAVGQPVPEALGLDDTTVEFEITPNRPDCLSMLGLAREAAATFDLPLRLHTPVVRGGGGDIRDYIGVTVKDTELCSRYIARVVKNIRIGPSPRWLRERLRACGVRPINNLVDITNYVCLEYGQPMHAFDLRCLGDSQIVVRRAEDGERLVLLDGSEKTLTHDMLVIADSRKPVGVAGVMGGESSGISDGTTTVVFESANFSGVSIRLTARALGVRTEASARYEKGLDPQNTYGAVQRACELVELLGCGEVVDGMIDIDNTGYTPTRLTLNAEAVNRLLGTDVPKQRMRDILTKLDFRLDGDEVTVPSYRMDVVCQADLAEEVARFYGYDNIPSTLHNGDATGRLTPRQRFENQTVQTLVGLGCYEIATYSFIGPKDYDAIRLPAGDPRRESVVISNPLGEDTSVMRTTIVPSMLGVLGRNYANRNAAVRLFELGNSYLPVQGQELPDERLRVCIGLYGEGEDFFTLKGLLETLLSARHIGGVEVAAARDVPWLHPGRAAVLSAGGQVLGSFGEVHPAVLENYGIGARAYVADLDFQTLFGLVDGVELQYRPLPRFPAVTRDLALLCDAELPVGALEKTIAGACGSLLEDLTLFDVYTGRQIADDKKSVAFSLVLRAPDRTLTDTEADAAVRRVLEALAKDGVALRS